MSTRSMTPRTSCSEPIGISVATTCGPKAAFSDSSVRKKSARSRSSMFTKTMRARSSSSARCHRRRRRDLDAHHGVDDEDRRLAHAQRAERVGDEARLAGRVDQVDLAVLPLERAQRRARSTSGAPARRGRRPTTVVPSTTVPRRLIDAGLEQQRLVQRRSCRCRGGRRGPRCGCGRALVHASSPLLGVRATDPSGNGHESVTPGGAASGISRRAASAAAGRPSCAAGRRATR